MLPLRDRITARRVPIVNNALIAANVVAFVVERALLGSGTDMGAFVQRFGLIPGDLARSPLSELPSLLTSMFLHDPTSWVHIGGNVLFLWIFGDGVEDALGRARYLCLYLACGLLAGLAHVMVNPASTVPLLGASGAISGVLAAYGSLYPKAPITVLNPVVPLWFVLGLTLDVPAWAVILEYFLLNLWRGVTLVDDSGGGTAFFAHLGGFVAGVFLVRVLLPSPWASLDRRTARGRQGPAGPAGVTAEK
jgi:membrane associated rhomboid family serine protease